MRIFRILFALCLIAVSAPYADAGPSKDCSDMKAQRQFVRKQLFGPAEMMPFSFDYGSVHSSALLSAAPRTIVNEPVRDARKTVLTTWKMEDGVEVTLKSIEYLDFPAVEWTLYIKNEGKADSKVISSLKAIRMQLQPEDGKPYSVHTLQGDDCTEHSFAPIDLAMAPGREEEFSPDLGKSTGGKRGWPYFNLQTEGKGTIMAIGWPGEWESIFRASESNDLSVTAGQKTFCSFLKPGEEIRTPMICLLFWKGSDRIEAQNLWRRFYLAHVIPHFNGQSEKPAMQIQISPAEKDTAYVQSFLDAGIKPRLCWRDAGWYPMSKGSWIDTGTWVIDSKQYPNGFRTFTDWIHKRGMEQVLWFEPERVGHAPSWLRTNHPEWLLTSPNDAGDILNEGDPACWNWLVNHVDSILVKEGIDWYREDMNGNGPLNAWMQDKTADRQGMIENQYVQAHLRYWDELKRRHPGLHFDSCASGGRRNDLETMHRAVPLLRSDYQWPFMGDNLFCGNQGHTWGLSQWLPFQGQGEYVYDTYSARSFYMASFGMGGLTEDNKAIQTQAYSECVRIAPMMLYGDYYPLTDYSIGKDRWIAWQFNRTVTGEGCVQVFRRENCNDSGITLKLRGLKPKATYEVTDFDKPGTFRKTGAELMEGLQVEIGTAPGAVILSYRKI